MTYSASNMDVGGVGTVFPHFLSGLEKRFYIISIRDLSKNSL